MPFSLESWQAKRVNLDVSIYLKFLVKKLNGLAKVQSAKGFDDLCLTSHRCNKLSTSQTLSY